ncbi:MAG: hypothetical protein WCK34_12285 [Bacteroidota bacterium]
MQGRFEKYLEEQGRLLDVESPDDEKIWNAISAELTKSRRLRIGLLGTAAMILFLVSSVTAFRWVVKQRQADDVNYPLRNVSEQLGREENIFRITVMRKLDEVKETGEKGKDYYSMMEQLEQIDRQYKTYMDDLKELGNQPKILKGIIRCYEMKIRVIEKTLNEIEKSRHNENEKHIL